MLNEKLIKHLIQYLKERPDCSTHTWQRWRTWYV